MGTELIRVNKNKKLRKVILVVILMFIAGGMLYSLVFSGVETEIIKASRSSIAQYIEETGEVECLDSQTIYSEGTGRVIEINFESGDRVTKDELLLKMDSMGTEMQLKEAEAKISAAMAQLAGTDIANYANQIEISKCAVENSNIVYSRAKREYENAKKLYEQNAISRDQYNIAEEAQILSEKALSAARYNLAEIEKGAPKHIRDGYKAQLEQAFAVRDSLANQLAKLTVKASSDGVVIEKYIDSNAYMTLGTPLFMLGNPDKTEILVNILSDEAYKVKAGSKVEVSGKAVGDEIFQGSVTKISPSAKTIVSSLGVNEKRVEVKVGLMQNSEMLKPGYNVDVSIFTAEKENALVVPDTAVFEYNGKDYVFVIEKGRAKLREIRKGIESKEDIEILEGLAENEPVISSPDNSIKEGVKIKGFKG